MRFAAMFFDALNPAEVDADLTKRHFAYLRERSDLIVSAGGLKAEVGGAFCGSLWVIEAETLDEARRIADEDPYCVAGLRPDRRVFIWNHAPIAKA